jgi:hypothetical protein
MAGWTRLRESAKGWTIGKQIRGFERTGWRGVRGSPRKVVTWSVSERGNLGMVEGEREEADPKVHVRGSPRKAVTWMGRVGGSPKKMKTHRAEQKIRLQHRTHPTTPNVAVRA